jgi:dTDP-glucose 4,6-dehydratase
MISSIVEVFSQPFNGLDVAVTRSTNNYGSFQHSEKLIPKLITNALRGKPLPVYGSGENVRDWILVEDNCNSEDR